MANSPGRRARSLTAVYGTRRRITQQPSIEGREMELSSRNQLPATVKSVRLGAVMAEVVMELAGGEEIVAAITRASAEGLQLAAGDRVFALVKATEVMVGRE